MERHEIPTHLEVADRAFLGLTMRQLLVASAGLALAYGALNDLPLPFEVRAAVAAIVSVGAAVLVLWRPVGRPAEEWAFVLLRYRTTPRVAVWRPVERRRPREPQREVVLRPVGTRASEEEVTDAA